MAAIYRVVGLNEAADITQGHGFRRHPSVGYQEGKWFAATFDDAVSWGRAMQRFTQPRPFRVVVVTVPRDVLDQFEYHPLWDAIGPAYYVRDEQLGLLNQSCSVTMLEPIYDEERSP